MNPNPNLTRREVEILAFLPARKTNREIAEALFITTRTVATHLTSIYAKLGVTNRTEAAIVASEAPPDVGGDSRLVAGPEPHGLPSRGHD